MNTLEKTIVAALGLALASSPAFAKKAEEQQDSVFSWGRWKVLAPAAGQNFIPSPLFVVHDLNAGEADDLTPKIIEQNGGDGGQGPGPLAGPCDAGTPCGFTSFDADKTEPGSAEDTGYFNIEFRREVANGNGVYPTVMVYGSVGEVDFEATSDDGGMHVARAGVPVDYFPAPSGERYRASDRSIVGSAFPDADAPEFSAGFWSVEGHSGLYVWGMATDQASLDALRAGNVIATYEGHVGASSAGGLANLTIDFGSASWSGDFSTSRISFSAQGGLDGPSFVSTSVGGDAASGIVEGAVLGSNAERAIGRFEVVDHDGLDHRDIFNIIRTDTLGD